MTDPHPEVIEAIRTKDGWQRRKAPKGSHKVCKAPSLRAELDRVRQQLAEAEAERIESERLFKRVLDELGIHGAFTEEALIETIQQVMTQQPAAALQTALSALVEQWHAEGARLDSVHATMGSGWKACADDLATLLRQTGTTTNETKDDVTRVDVHGDK